MTKIKNLDLLQSVFDYFNSCYKNSPIRPQIKSLGLNIDTLKQSEIIVGYNPAQFHFRKKKDIYPIDQCSKMGLLTVNHHGGYRVWGKHGVIIPLRDRKDRIVNLFAFKPNKPEVNIYLNKQGLFPRYPNTMTTRIIITHSLVDACLLIQIQELRDKYTVLALDEFTVTKEFLVALRKLNHLVEIIFIEGEMREVIPRTINVLKIELPKIIFSIVEIPDWEPSLCSILASNHPSIIPSLIENRSNF